MYTLLVLILDNLRAPSKWNQQENYATCTEEALLSYFNLLVDLAENLNSFSK